MPTKGGKQNTNCADTEGILRIIQEIPSKKAEPFKLWLARLGKERLDEIEQPGKAIERAKGYYASKGYSKDWIETRTLAIDTRNSFTETLKDSNIKEGYEYAILTNEVYKSWSGYTAAEYKDHKKLNKSDSLRDNMTPMELVATIFSETASKEIIKETNPNGFYETKDAIHVAGNITKDAVEKIERKTGKKIVTHKNSKSLENPEVRKKLAQDSLPNSIEGGSLSEFDKNLKKALDFKD